MAYELDLKGIPLNGNGILLDREYNLWGNKYHWVTSANYIAESIAPI